MPGRFSPVAFREALPRPAFHESLLGDDRTVVYVGPSYSHVVEEEVAALAKRLAPRWAAPKTTCSELMPEPSLRAEVSELMRGSPLLAPPGSIRSWHEFLTWACLVVYGPPTLAALRLAWDPSAWFWAGPGGWLVLCVPLLIAFWHSVHVSFDAPRVAPVLIGTLMPAVLLVVFADIYVSSAESLSRRLVSTDCATFPEKFEVQHSWEAASDLYRRCVNRTAANQGLGMEQAARMLRLQDCREYQAALSPDVDTWAEHLAAWEYLREMEESSECSGWCYHTRPIWTVKETKDPCSVAAGIALETQVKPLAHQIMGYCCVVIAATLAIVALARRLGRQWS